jgi:hypothetical protein
MLAKPVIKDATTNYHRLIDVRTLLLLATLIPFFKSVKN